MTGRLSLLSLSGSQMLGGFHEAEQGVPRPLIIFLLLFLHELKPMALPVVLAREEPARVDAKPADDRRQRVEAWMIGRMLHDVAQLFLIDLERLGSGFNIATEASVDESLHTSGKRRRVHIRH